MKRTDQERIERELRRREKRVRVTERKVGGPRPEASPSAYIAGFVEAFHFDSEIIYNTTDDENVLELLITMKEDLPEKDWEGVLRSAIRKTKVQAKDQAFEELKGVLDDC